MICPFSYEDDCHAILDCLVEEIKNREYQYLCQKLNDREVFFHFLPAIVRRFDLRNLENFLTLIEYSQQYFVRQMRAESRLLVILLKTLEELMLLDSLQAMNLWAVAKTSLDNRQQSRIPDEDDDDEEVENDEHQREVQVQLHQLKLVVDTLAKRKSRLLLQYQRLVEDDEVIHPFSIFFQEKSLLLLTS